MDYQRVTEILYPFSGMKYVKKEVLKNAAARGTKVHQICEAIAKGLGGWEAKEEYQPYVDSFNFWWKKKRNIISIEERFYCSELKLTGKVDFITKEPKGLYIVDLKTSQQESKSWLLQGSAYSYLAKKKGYDIKGIMFLQLKRDGKPAKEYYYDENMDLFKKCLEVYRYFYGKKGKKNYGKK